MFSVEQVKENRESGFTLIELLVVILIIGVLSAIAIPAFLSQRKEASDASVKSDLKNAAVAMETALVNNKSSYPSTLPTTVKTSDGVKLSLQETVTTIDRLTAQGWIKIPLTSSNPDEADTHFYVQAYNHYFRIRMEGPWVTVPNNTFFYFEYEITCGNGTFKRGTAGYGLLHKATPVHAYVTNCNSSSTAQSIKISPLAGTKTGYQPENVTIAYPAGSPENNKPVSDGKSYCINGYHASTPEKLWHYDSANGGIKEGKCS